MICRGTTMSLLGSVLAFVACTVAGSPAACDCVSLCTGNDAYQKIACPDDCQKYCECKPGGTAALGDCVNLGFDQTTQSCIFKGNADRCTSGNLGGVTAASASDCKENGQLLWDKANICHNFLKCDCTSSPCSLDVTATAPCPDGGLFDRRVNKCVPKGTYVCEESGPRCSDDTKGYDGKFIAYKENCAGFYYCKDNVRSKGSCDPNKYYFDPIGQQCATKNTENPCKAIPGSSSPSSSDDEVDLSTVCVGNAGRFVEDPRVCTGYIYCMSEKKYIQNICANNRYYDNQQCVSNPPKRCTCEEFLEKLKALISTDPDAEEYAPHPDKNKFYVCTLNGRTEKTCPSGSLWSIKEKSCVSG